MNKNHFPYDIKSNANIISYCKPVTAKDIIKLKSSFNKEKANIFKKYNLSKDVDLNLLKTRNYKNKLDDNFINEIDILTNKKNIKKKYILNKKDTQKLFPIKKSEIGISSSIYFFSQDTVFDKNDNKHIINSYSGLSQIKVLPNGSTETNSFTILPRGNCYYKSKNHFISVYGKKDSKINLTAQSDKSSINILQTDQSTNLKNSVNLDNNGILLSNSRDKINSSISINNSRISLESGNIIIKNNLKDSNNSKGNTDKDLIETPLQLTNRYIVNKQVSNTDYHIYLKKQNNNYYLIAKMYESSSVNKENTINNRENIDTDLSLQSERDDEVDSMEEFSYNSDISDVSNILDIESNTDEYYSDNSISDSETINNSIRDSNNEKIKSDNNNRTINSQATTLSV